MGPYRFCSGGTLDKPSSGYRFGYRVSVGPYGFCSDGNPHDPLNTTLVIPNFVRYSYVNSENLHKNQGIVGCTPTNVPLWEIPIFSPYKYHGYTYVRGTPVLVPWKKACWFDMKAWWFDMKAWWFDMKAWWFDMNHFVHTLSQLMSWIFSQILLTALAERHLQHPNKAVTNNWFRVNTGCYTILPQSEKNYDKLF